MHPKRNKDLHFNLIYVKKTQKTKQTTKKTPAKQKPQQVSFYERHRYLEYYLQTKQVNILFTSVQIFKAVSLLS